MIYKHPQIRITKDDLRKSIYFILMKFRGDPLHRQGTSAKRDLIGGYIERWFNRIAENVIFDDLLANKEFRIVTDNFVYRNDSDKNAPDILGLKTAEGIIIPFAKYNNGSWYMAEGMPRIEVKVVRKDQVLLGVRDPQLIDDYYAFIESDLAGDYLSAIFEEEVFKDTFFDELAMPQDFIKEDQANQIVMPSKQSKAQNLGTMRLIGIYSKDELLKYTTLCAKGISPYYFASADNIEKFRKGRVSDKARLEIKDNGLAEYFAGEDKVYLPFSILGSRSKELRIVKSYIGSLYIETGDALTINGAVLKPGIIKLTFKKFERSSAWSEHVALKYTLENYGKDSTDELISRMGEITKSSLSVSKK